MLRTYTFHTSIGYISLMAYSLGYAYTLLSQHYPKDIVVHNVSCGL